jgi:hypothetical protein
MVAIVIQLLRGSYELSSSGSDDPCNVAEQEIKDVALGFILIAGTIISYSLQVQPNHQCYYIPCLRLINDSSYQ